jgi:hypothetical protein
MRTKIEILAAYLAGHRGEDVESLRRELEDPSSAASRWLEAIQARSRKIFAPGSPEVLDFVATRPDRLPTGRRFIALRPNSAEVTAPTTPVSKSRASRIVWSASAAALLLLAVGAAWRAENDRLRRIERLLDRRDVGWVDHFKHLEEALTKLDAPPQRQKPAPKEPSLGAARSPMLVDPPVRLALNRIEGKLVELEQRLGESRTSQALDDQRIADFRRDLDQLKQEVQTSSRAVHEVLVLLRRLARMTQTQEPLQFPTQPQGMDPRFGGGPGMMFRPGQLPNEGQMHNQGPSSTFRSPGAK